MIKILKLLNPQPSISGLEITDLSLRLLTLKNGQARTYSVKLEPGVVVEGKLQNKEEFLKSLLKLREQITKKLRKQIFVILNISAANVYSQIFSLPSIAEKNLEEASRLNLQMISPINISDAYFDCQKVGESVSEDKIEIVGAFIYKNIIDAFSEAFLKANFVIVAIEFMPLAISRVVKKLASNFDKQASYILFQISSDGLNFIVIKNGNLYFNYFTSWRSLKGDKRYISPKEFELVVIEETKKIISFYNRNWTDQIKGFLVMAQGLNAEVEEIVHKNFSFQTEEIMLKKFDQIGPAWFGSLGSALRGQIDRSEDNIISLTSTGTEEEFKRQTVVTFIHLWQKIVFSFLAFVLIVLGAADVFLGIRVNSSNAAKDSITLNKNQNEFINLQNQAKEFNQKVSLLARAKSEVFAWPDFLTKVKGFASQDGVEISRIAVQGDNKSLVISGRAATEKAATDFKQRLAGDNQFKEVSMPLSGIKPSAGNSIEFYINLQFN
ncbi:MAG: pilus assembly protein PilM [Candidatus Paceibacterota bacterium]|jgi:hypothetical protein